MRDHRYYELVIMLELFEQISQCPDAIFKNLTVFQLLNWVLVVIAANYWGTGPVPSIVHVYILASENNFRAVIV